MSIHLKVNETFHVSKEKVYESLLDLDSAKNWMKGFVGIERLNEGQLQVGSAWKETRKMYGTESTEHFEVVELEKPNKIILRCDGTKGTTGKGEYLFTYTITSTGNVTEVTLDGEIKGLTGFVKLMGKMMAGTFKKACAKDLEALKQHLEAGTVPLALHDSNKL